MDAMRLVRRAAFVPDEWAAQAEVDEPIPIPHGQVTTQPSLVARMMEALKLTGTERVLEVGPGLGYQTAILPALARRERRPSTRGSRTPARRTAMTIESSAGWPERLEVLGELARDLPLVLGRQQGLQGPWHDPDDLVSLLGGKIGQAIPAVPSETLSSSGHRIARLTSAGPTPAGKRTRRSISAKNPAVRGSGDEGTPHAACATA